MKYNFIETDDVLKTILDLNHISFDELNKEYDYKCKDETFTNFLNKLNEYKDQRFLIVGDYDCDGICSTTIIKRLFNKLNINSNFYINSRLKDGYGLNNRIVDMAHENNFDVLFLVDNGIVCNETIDYAYSLGLKVFIIDHHEFTELPKAEAIIHSDTVSDMYSHLSAGGLSFVLSSLVYLDEMSIVLSGLSTLSDVMDVVGFNRYLIKEMMNILNSKSIFQLNMLNDNEKFNYLNLSFNVIPKINALSRMEPLGNPNNMVQFFLSEKGNYTDFIERINYINEKRKNETRFMANEALKLINNDDIVCVASKDFSEGLCGPISNRLIYETGKPSIVLAGADRIYKGSGRSIEGFNLYESLKTYDKYEAFGGHDLAIGLSIKEENLEDFNNYLKNIKVSCLDYSKDVILVDSNIVNMDLLKLLDSFKPFGGGFIEPLIAIKNNDYSTSIVANKYLKFFVNNNFTCICFNEKHTNRKPEYIIGKLQIDNYHKDAIQLVIEDLA